MCGIYAYIGNKPAAPSLIEGIKKLEYRGYDSVGISTIENGTDIVIHKVVGNTKKLKSNLSRESLDGTIGIAHTRWATHGKISKANAHPHISNNNDVAISHNGIIENYLDLKQELLNDNFTFKSETDSEIISHLISKFLNEGISLESSISKLTKKIKGASSIVGFTTQSPDTLFALKIGNAGGLLISNESNFSLVASDTIPLIGNSKKFIALEDRDIALIKKNKISISNNNKIVTPKFYLLEDKKQKVTKSSFSHFMEKEINDQGQSALYSLNDRVDFENHSIEFKELIKSLKTLNKIKRVILIGMGSSFNACMLGAKYFESLTKIPAFAENSSEFLYSEKIISKEDLIIAITQSGETAETIRCIEKSKQNGCYAISLVEQKISQAGRISDICIPLNCGQEFSVAATKTFTSSLIILYTLALFFASKTNNQTDIEVKDHLSDLNKLPRLIGETIQQQSLYKKISKKIYSKDHLLYLGRENMLPIASEGALKMKEVSYLHAEAYPAGEMKHGVNALIGPSMPTIILAPSDELHSKMINTINEILSRNGNIIALISEGDKLIPNLVDECIVLPNLNKFLNPILFTIPLQLIAFHTAISKKLNPDRPRNLAKTVTVE
ncbi:MAG: glutamine--fructose-6-phosphate transaminase (isomerizing) [Dehalococcoidia bacterium]|jgi:glucosamine--fructose-6-phosphate aminotransferase (isomerizing)|nr:glutamine--fructose-6-phosphate transaminase (isomerizing) [Dehalococcoidia bacterium]